MAESVIEILIKARDQTRGTLKKLDETVTRLGRNKGLDKVSKSSKKAQTSLVRLDKTAAKTGKSLNALSIIKFAALAAGIVAATRSFLEFNKGIAEISTLVDSTVVSNEELSESVLELSANFGSKPTETAKALYQAISAGAQAGEEANKLLEVALKAAIGGVTTAEVAVDGLTSIINAFGLEMDDAESISDSLFTAVKGGKTNFEELAASISNVAPIAAAAGVSFQEVNAALAALTLGGTQTAKATTQLRALIAGLTRDTPELTKVFGELGGAQAVLAGDDGLRTALRLIEEATEGDIGALTRLTGSIEANQAVFGLAGDKAQLFNDALRDQADAAGASEEAFQKVNKEISQRFSVAITNLEVGFLKLTASLEPVLAIVADLIEEFGKFIGTVGDADAVLDFFDQLGPSLDAIGENFTTLTETIGDFFRTITGGTDNTEALVIALDFVADAFKILSFLVAGLADGINFIIAVFQDLAAAAADVAFVIALIGPASDETLDSLRNFAKESKAAAEETFAAFERGDTAFARLNRRIEEAALNTAEMKRQAALIAPEFFDADDAGTQYKETMDEAADSTGKTTKAVEELAFSLKDLARITKNENAIALKNLEDQLDDNLISFREYFAERLRLQRETIDAEIAVANNALNVESNLEKRKTIEAQLIILQQQRAQIGVAAARAEAEATGDLNDELQDVERLLAEREGGAISLEFQTEEIEAKFSDLLDRLEAEGDVRGQEIVRKLINAEVFEAELDVIEDSFNATFDNFEARAALIAAQADAGLITQAQAINDLAVLRAETLPQLELERDVLAEIAERTGDPAAIARLALVQEKLNELNETTVTLGTQIQGVFVDGVGNAIESIIDGTKTAKEAFRDFARSAFAEVAKLILQQIVLNALKSFGFGGAQGGLVTAGGIQTGGFASGGFVSGAGGPTGDKISAKLSSGEYVMKARSVRNYGVGFMEAINRSVFPKLEIGNRTLTVPRVKNHFAEGGMVTDSGSSKADESAPSPSSLRIINVDGGMDAAKEFATSSENETVVMNIMRRNQGQVKQYLR